MKNIEFMTRCEKEKEVLEIDRRNAKHQMDIL